jgi:anti-sigma regulatory factor (Ser/Thr protein kinase)
LELRVARTFEAIAGIHTAIEDFCAQRAISESATFAVKLVVEELFTNLVKYNRGGGETILLGLERTDDRLIIRLTDHDVDSFDPAQVPPVDVSAPLATRRAGGLGLHLVRSYVDEFDYEYTDRTMRITAIKILEADDV